MSLEVELDSYKTVCALRGQQLKDLNAEARQLEAMVSAVREWVESPEYVGHKQELGYRAAQKDVAHILNRHIWNR